MWSSMQLKKPATVGSYESHQPNPFVPMGSVLGRPLPLFPGARPTQIRLRVGLPERARSASEEPTLILQGVKPRALSRLLR